MLSRGTRFLSAAPLHHIQRALSSARPHGFASTPLAPLLKNKLRTASFPGVSKQRGMSACPGCSDQDMEDYGPSRSEVFSTPLAGTLERYDGHVFICLSSPPETWPSDALGVPTAGGLAVGTILSGKVKAAMKNMPEGTAKMRVTPCHALSSDEEGDLLYFPPSSAGGSRKLRTFKAASEEALQTFVDEVIVKGNTDTSAVPSKPLDRKQLFVCCHTQRDKRCGVCGPPLVTQLSSALGGGGQVRACSHVGGHSYAGNVLVYGNDMDWYGYVSPKDVASFAKALEAEEPGVVSVKLWRGRMGMTPDEHKAKVESMA
mmetsp:Transcript_27565/g.64080  ORF Transcript_27565/g.64080 Transcript_27565/m.64080 type:complete len:316 (-) Transcript_27565:254-1201(-)